MADKTTLKGPEREQRWRDAAFGTATRNGETVPVEPGPQIDAVVHRLIALADAEQAELRSDVRAIADDLEERRKAPYHLILASYVVDDLRAVLNKGTDR